MQANRDNGVSQKPSTVFNQRIRMKRKIEQCAIKQYCWPVAIMPDTRIVGISTGGGEKKPNSGGPRPFSIKHLPPEYTTYNLSLLLQTDFETIDNAHLKE